MNKTDRCVPAGANRPPASKHGAVGELTIPLAFHGSTALFSDRFEFRGITAGDLDFLQQLYRTTREPELEKTAWSEAEKSAFIAGQFQAQHSYYQAHFPKAAYLLVSHQKQSVGRVYLDRRANEMRLIDIALIPQWRGRGLGRHLLRELIEEARARGLPIRIHVERFNPAMRLYLRLGFTPVEDLQVYQLMEWRPDSPAD